MNTEDDTSYVDDLIASIFHEEASPPLTSTSVYAQLPSLGHCYAGAIRTGGVPRSVYNVVDLFLGFRCLATSVR